MGRNLPLVAKMSVSLNTQFNLALKFKVEFVITDLMQYISSGIENRKEGTLETSTTKAENYQSQNGVNVISEVAALTTISVIND